MSFDFALKYLLTTIFSNIEVSKNIYALGFFDFFFPSFFSKHYVKINQI